MYFGIYDSYTVKNLKLNGEKTILVRCLSKSEYSNKSTMIENSTDYSNILQLYINDNNSFNLDDAKLLNDFIINNDFDEVLTHCALGISRSPAIMICISKIINCPYIENTVKERYRFYNKAIVDTFENYNYETKVINETEFIFRDKYTQSKDSKKLIKVNTSID